MSRFFDELKDFWKKGDIFLLVLCLIVSGFGCVFIASATSADKFGGNIKYIIIQLAATGLGVMMYALVSSVDLDFLSEHRMVMVAFNCALLLMLISPLGTDHDSGNRSWIDLGFTTFQPSEIAFSPPRSVRSPMSLLWRRSCRRTRTGYPVCRPSCTCAFTWDCWWD